MKRLLLLIVALIVYGSLYPWHFVWWRGSHTPLGVLLHSWPAAVDRWVLRDVAINILLYFPLGLAAFLTLARHRSKAAAMGSALLLGAGLSTSIELLQVYVPGRVSSLLDIACNVAGTAAGAIAALLLGSRVERLLERRSQRMAGAAALLLVCWAAYQAFPFFPALTHTKLRNSLYAFEQGFDLSPVEVFTSAAEWFAAGLAARTIFGRLRWWWMAAALGILAVRLLIATRGVSPSEVIGALCAALLWAVIPERWKLRVGVCWLGLAVGLSELHPFHFSAEARRFSWLPFQATLTSDWQPAVVILARKAFDYGAMIWLLRKNGLGDPPAGAAMAASLFVFELVQMYLPGRTPEITDSVLALLMMTALCRIDQINNAAGAVE